MAHSYNPTFHWPHGYEIVVDDFVLEAIKHKKPARQKQRRKDWREDREVVLMTLSDLTGLRFVLNERNEGKHVDGSDGSAVMWKFRNQVPEGHIWVVRTRMYGGSAQVRQFNDNPDPMEQPKICAAVVAIDPAQGFFFHEMGHAMGLGHRGNAPYPLDSRTGGIMDYNHLYDDEVPDAHDVEELGKLYLPS
jgi:hypothetical protein